MFKAAVSSSWSPGDGEVDAASWERWMSKAKANSWCVGEVCVKIHFFLLIATTKKSVSRIHGPEMYFMQTCKIVS